MIPTARLPCGAPTRWCRRPASPGWSSTPSWSLKACSVPAWPAWHPATRCTWKSALWLPDPGTLRARRRPVAAGLGHRAVGLPVHPARPRGLERLPPHHPGARRPYRRRAGLSRGNRKPRPPPGPGQPLRHRSAQTRLPAHRHPRSLARHAARTADHPDRRRPPGAARRPGAGPETTRVMLCGNPAMLADARKLLGERGFKTDAAAFPVIWPWKTIGDGKVPGDALVRKSSVWHCART